MRELCRGDYGIIHINPDRDRRRAELLKKGYAPDDEEYVELLNEDGEFIHGHFISALLEKVDEKQLPEDIKEAMLYGSYLIKGEGTITDLQDSITRMSENTVGIKAQGNIK